LKNKFAGFQVSGLVKGVASWDDEVGGGFVVGFHHEAAVDFCTGEPRVEGDVGEEVEGDGPEGFWDDLEPGGGGEVLGEVVEVEPFAAAAVGIEEFGGGGFWGVEVIEEAAVNEMLGDDGLAAEFFGEMALEKAGELELVGAEALEF